MMPSDQQQMAQESGRAGRPLAHQQPNGAGEHQEMRDDGAAEGALSGRRLCGQGEKS